MEVRDAYAREEFEWEQLKRVAISDLQAGNVRLLRQVSRELWVQKVCLLQTARVSLAPAAAGERGAHLSCTTSQTKHLNAAGQQMPSTASG